MSTSCMQAIKQQLEAMPLEEFEDLLKAVNKGHEGMGQHAELLSQLKHHVKVQPDEPIQTKASDKDCRTFWKSLNQRENKSHRLSNSSSSGSSSSGCSNLNGNVSVSGNHNSQYNHHNKHSSSSLFGSGTSGSRSFPTGDQNANPISASSEPPSSTYYHQPVQSLIQGKYHDYNNHHHIHHHSTLAYGNSDADPGGGLSRRSHHERDSKNDNISSSNKNSYSTANDDQDDDDDDDDEDEDRPEIYTGTLPAQYILPNVTKATGGPLGSSDVPIKFATNRNQYQSLGTPSSLDGSSTSSTPSLTQSRLLDTPAPSTSWENNRHAVQLNESYKSVSSVTSGASSSFLTRSSSSSLEQTHGSVRAISPTLPVAYPNAIITKSPTAEGSQDKPPRRGGDRKKKSSKNVLRETVINPQLMPGYKGQEKDIDKLLEFVEGNQTKPAKKNSKDKKKEVKPKGNEKQMLSKAASLDENTLEYGSKKSEESLSRSRNSKEVEKKNATNITKSSTALSVGGMTIHTKQSTESTNSREEIPTGKTKSISTPLVNGTAGPLATKNGNGGGNGAKPATPSVKPSVSPKSQQSVEKSPAPEDEVAPTVKPEPSPPPAQPVISKPSKPLSMKKTDDDKTGKLDESDGPYVLVQSKKKKEKKKSQQREAEAFVRPTTDQQRRDVARARRSTAERRKSVGSVPGSENSECSDDDDSVRSLPAGECTPRERIPKPCSSSGGTPQTSYADIARMSRDESGKPPSTPIAILSSASASANSKTPPSSTKSTSSSSSSASGAPAVTSDSAFPALSPPTAEKTAPINNAVWPCRPRIESEPSTKEKSTPGQTPKSPDLASKEEQSPLEASSLSSPSQSDISKCSSKLSTDKDSSTASKSVAEPPVSKPVDLQSSNEVGGDEKPPQGTLRKAEPTVVSATESLRSLENCVDGFQLNNKTRKPEEKKGKSNKVSEEGANKTASIKGMENGDISSCHQEPVVFCGGKFDSSQLPAGQNIGFEFGFGVIEALNDNVVAIDPTPSPPNANPTPVELPQLVLAQVEGKTANERLTRSQEQVSNLQTTENCWDKVSKADKTSKFQSSHEKQTVMSSTKSKGTSNLQGEPTEVRPSSSLEIKGSQPQPNMVISAKNSTPVPVPSTDCKEAKQETLSSVSPANLPTEAGAGTSTVLDGKSAELLSQGKLDVAQLFVPSTAENIPESVYLSRDFMDTYAEVLANLSRQGKVTYHRVD